jgi:hypothetical protein
MTTTQTSCPSFGELAEYWTSDIATTESERLEAHVFECNQCARLLAQADQLRTAIGDLAQAGAIQAFVTDAVLNRLARDGVRVRSYALGPGESVRCAVWADDDVLVTRLRGDFTGITSVDAEMRFDTGEDWGRVTDVPVRDGATEIVFALPASLVRKAPNAPMRLILRGAVAGSSSGNVLAEYVFHHEGALDRRTRNA